MAGSPGRSPSRTWPPGPGRGGSCLRERRFSTKVPTPCTKIPSAVNTAATAMRKKYFAQESWGAGVAPGSSWAWIFMAAAAMTRQPPDPAAARTSGRRRAGGDGRAGAAAGEADGVAGMSAVSAARSAQVRADSAWPARVSSSALVSRPSTNAAFSASITCSRSVWAALSWSSPVAALSCGPVITSTFPPHDAVERSAAAPRRPWTECMTLHRVLPDARLHRAHARQGTRHTCEPELVRNSTRRSRQPSRSAPRGITQSGNVAQLRSRTPVTCSTTCGRRSASRRSTPSANRGDPRLAEKVQQLRDDQAEDQRQQRREHVNSCDPVKITDRDSITFPDISRCGHNCRGSRADREDRRDDVQPRLRRGR